MPTELLAGMAAAIIISTVKNPAHKASLKALMLKIFKTIQAAYAGDKDFV